MSNQFINVRGFCIQLNFIDSHKISHVLIVLTRRIYPATSACRVAMVCLNAESGVVVLVEWLC